MMADKRKIPNEELDRLNVEEFRSSEKIPVMVMLDNIRSALNVGSIFRTADAFRLEKILITGITATPPHRDIRKTALGATESVEWEKVEEPMDRIVALKEQGYEIIAIEQVEGSSNLDEFSFEPDKKYLLILGHEVKGVSQELVDLSDHCIEIPQLGTKHSLNVAVAAGMAIWQLAVKTGALKA